MRIGDATTDRNGGAIIKDGDIIMTNRADTGGPDVDTSTTTDTATTGFNDRRTAVGNRIAVTGIPSSIASTDPTATGTDRTGAMAGDRHVIEWVLRQ